MPRNKSGSANGGLIGKRNLSSFGKCTQTAKTSSGNVTTQPGTRVVQTLIVAGGGGGARSSGGGGGAGGLRNIEVPDRDWETEPPYLYFLFFNFFLLYI